MRNKITAEIMEDIELFYDEMLSVRDTLYKNGTEIRSEEDNEYIMDILYNNAKEVLYNRIRQKLDLINTIHWYLFSNESVYKDRFMGGCDCQKGGCDCISRIRFIRNNTIL